MRSSIGLPGAAPIEQSFDPAISRVPISDLSFSQHSACTAPTCETAHILQLAMDGAFDCDRSSKELEPRSGWESQQANGSTPLCLLDARVAW